MVMDKMEELELPVRIVQLKPRARGSTTYITGIGYTIMRRTSTSAIFIGGQSDQTVGLWNMFKVYAKNDAFDWGNTGDVNEKGATFSNGSRAKKETAKDVQAGIGDTYQFMQCTEAARWAQFGVSNAAAVMNNLLKAVPLLPHTYIFLESTAETAGGDFFTRFTGAVDYEDFLSGDKEVGFGSYVRVFAAWFEFEESALRLTAAQKAHIQATLDADEEWAGEKELIQLYAITDDAGVQHLGESVTEFDVWEQLAWRRYAIHEECDRDVDIFNRDYPHSWQTAFQKAGKMRFNSTGVAILRKRPQKPALHGMIEEAEGRRVAFRQAEAGEAQFTLWEKPIAGCRYILPVDTMTGESQAMGLDPDKHSAPVMRAGYWDSKGKWNRKAVVARVVPCRWEIDMITAAVWKLSRYYGRCIIAIEVNMDRGMIELLKLVGANLYAREVLNRRETKLTSALGFQTNTQTREQIISTLASTIREWDTPGNGIDIWCPHIITQLENFIRKEPSGKSEASQGFHDDDVIALALGDELIEQATLFVPLRDVFGPPRDDGDSGTKMAGSAYS